MTLVLGAFTLAESFLVTDRLVSLQRRGGLFAGEHDDTSNKNVIYVADDGIVVLGYTGSAYVHGIPTDKFIAECLYDEGIPDEVFMGNRVRRLRGKVGDRLFALRQLCSENWTAGFVRILAVGYRDYRRLLRPFLVQFDLGEHEFGGPLMRLKTPARLNFGLASIGASLTSAEINTALAQSSFSTHLGNPDHVPDFLRRIIQNKAAVDPTVGVDTMSIRIRGRERYIDCEFLSARDHKRIAVPAISLDEQRVAFTPWAVGWQSFVAPSYITTSQPLCLSSGGWTVRLFGAEAEDGKAAVLLSGQSRKPTP